MVFYCEVCRQTYELNRTDISCIYCGASACRPYELTTEEE